MSPEANVAVGVENWERFGTWPSLCANWFSCHTFMDAARRHGTPTSEAKALVPHSSSSSRVPAFSCVGSPKPQFPQVTCRGPGNMCTHRGCITGEDPAMCLGPTCFMVGRGVPSPSSTACHFLFQGCQQTCSEGRHALYLQRLRSDLFSHMEIKGKRGRQGPDHIN